MADKHEDWLNMAKSFGLSTDDSNELVQQMYVRVYGYVDNIDKILYNDNEVNTFYIYVTLRNLYLSTHHKPNNKFVYLDDFVKLDEIPDDSFDIINQKEEFENLIGKIESEVDKWYWYDKKIFNIHFAEGMSMRKIAKETKISLSSIFNTLTNIKQKIRNKTKKDYEKYQKTK